MLKVRFYTHAQPLLPRAGVEGKRTLLRRRCGRHWRSGHFVERVPLGTALLVRHVEVCKQALYAVQRPTEQRVSFDARSTFFCQKSGPTRILGFVSKGRDV